MSLDAIDNLHLIENGLLHLRFELEQATPSYFRMDREAHLVLYRAMIERLRGSANLAVVGRRSKNPEYKYRLGNKEWQQIHKVEVTGCEKAWRFSEPVPCKEPSAHQDLCEKNSDGDHLIAFYHALAMIQTECFMKQLLPNKSVSVADADMKTLEWLHEHVRNEYEHFKPMCYMAPVSDLLMAARLCMRLSQELLFVSTTCIFFPMSGEALERRFREVAASLDPTE